MPVHPSTPLGAPQSSREFNLKTGKLAKGICHQLTCQLSKNWIPKNKRWGRGRENKEQRKVPWVESSALCVAELAFPWWAQVSVV